ncbi:MAG: hypothetical protein GY839_18700 [candidate division Zixibacteria bacterium]|nr:hypothetical protein [candidate division Zixibacteria bacterium]
MTAIVRTSIGIFMIGLFILWAFTYTSASESMRERSRADVVIFDQNTIHFDPNEPSKYATDTVLAEDNGRIIITEMNLPEHEGPVKIIAHLAIHPIPKDEISMHDPWDRAGNIRLCVEGTADIEVIKFITAYGGFTEYEVDVSHLDNLLKGPCTFRAFIDTWSTPGWKIDFELSYEWPQTDINPIWATGILYKDSFNKKDIGDKGVEVTIEIPKEIKRVKMNYLVSGHCTDGTDADEFVSKDNVIYVDDIAVFRYKPWRDDCRRFREVNPYTRRWSDGYWSSDYSRSGWCPGDMVKPLQLDLTDHLAPGKHKIRFVIEDIRPEDENGHFGYWRVSSYLLGWTKK